MKTNNRIMLASIAVLCLALTLRARAGDPASDPLPYHDVEFRSDVKPDDGMPARCNRASGLIGMDVRNQAAERLGRIKDLVFDLKTERMSYAVISTKPRGLFASGEKLLAVPLNALMASADGKHLILNAAESKVETAMGFKRDHWPAVDNPDWGSARRVERVKAAASVNPVVGPEVVEVNAAPH